MAGTLSAAYPLDTAVSEALQLRNRVSKHRGTQIGSVTVVLFGLLFVPDVQLHRKDGRY